MNYSTVTLEQIIREKTPINAHQCVLFNRIDIVKYLIDNGTKFTEKDINAAAFMSHEDIFDLLMKAQKSLVSSITLKMAIMSGCATNIADKILSLPIPISDDVLICAIINKQFDIVHKLIDRGVPIDDECITEIVSMNLYATSSIIRHCIARDVKFKVRHLVLLAKQERFDLLKTLIITTNFDKQYVPVIIENSHANNEIRELCRLKFNDYYGDETQVRV